MFLHNNKNTDIVNSIREVYPVIPAPSLKANKHKDPQQKRRDPPEEKISPRVHKNVQDTSSSSMSQGHISPRYTKPLHSAVGNNVGSSCQPSPKNPRPVVGMVRGQPPPPPPAPAAAAADFFEK